MNAQQAFRKLYSIARHERRLGRSDSDAYTLSDSALGLLMFEADYRLPLERFLAPCDQRGICHVTRAVLWTLHDRFYKGKGEVL